MFSRRETRMYAGVDRDVIYPQICDFWARQGFYVAQLSPFQIHGESFYQKIGLKREFYLRIDEHEGSTYIDLHFSAKVTDEGLIGGVVAAVVFLPVALVGGAVSYSEYEGEANRLMAYFWGYVDQLTDMRGCPVQPPMSYPPPPQPPVPPVDKIPCKGCGALLPKTWKACPYCGFVLMDGTVHP